MSLESCMASNYAYIKGKPSFKLRGRKGVYLIYEDDKLVYIGCSNSCVYKALYRHFQEWRDGLVKRICYNKSEHYKVRVVLLPNPGIIEEKLIRKYLPRDNTQYVNDEPLERFYNEEDRFYFNVEKECPF